MKQVIKTGSMNPQRPWSWEGNVVRVMRAYLRRTNWKLEPSPNTALHEKGPDIKALKVSKTLIIEVKGFPSKRYQYGKKRGQAKKSSRSTQARHWFAEVILTIILRKHKFPHAQVAIALPRFPTYEDLFKRSRKELGKMGIWTYFVDRHRNVKRQL